MVIIKFEVLPSDSGVLPASGQVVSAGMLPSSAECVRRWAQRAMTSSPFLSAAGWAAFLMMPLMASLSFCPEGQTGKSVNEAPGIMKGAMGHPQ